MIVAHSRGYLCPSQSFDGQVHSVFARSVNITTSLRQTPWVSVLDSSLPATPTGFQCSLAAVGNLTAKLQVGDGAFMRGGIIRFKPSCRVQVNTLAALSWQPEPALSQLDHPLLQRNLRAVEQALLAHLGQEKSQPVTALDDYLKLSGLTVSERLGAIPEALFDNIGKGRGLTPAGDDFLLGVLAAAHGLRPLLPQAEQVIQRLTAPGLFNAYQTTSVSAHYLQLALAGHFSQPVQRLVFHLLQTADATQVQQALNATLAIGASSGADTSAGIVYAIGQLLPHRI
jgi:hypothetical protein